MYQRIVVALDGSGVAEQALGEAGELARRLGVPVHLLRVVDPYLTDHASLTGMFVDEQAVEGALHEEDEIARRYLQSVADRLGAEGRQATIEVARGPVHRTIVERTGANDLLVLVSHGRGGLKRWLLGSVAEAVVRHARTPVLLVRARPDDDKQDED